MPLRFRVRPNRYHSSPTWAILFIAAVFAQSALAGDFAEALPRCTDSDSSQCKEECRKEFADAFTHCTRQCLAKRCDPSPPKDQSSDFAEQDSSCVEFESASCKKDCSGEGSAYESRCRRSCLQSRCPEAAPLELTKEAADPGIIGCERCRERNLEDCKRGCLAGSTSFDGKFPGLYHLGCEKLCVMAACTESCGSRIP